MGCSRFLHVVMMTLCAGMMGAHAVAAEVVSTPPVSRVEVVLASQYKNQIADSDGRICPSGDAQRPFSVF